MQMLCRFDDLIDQCAAPLDFEGEETIHCKTLVEPPVRQIAGEQAFLWEIDGAGHHDSSIVL